MPLTIYRRHDKSCRATSRHYRRCSCPIWVQGITSDGRKLRQSLKTNAWAEAESKARELDRGRAKRIPTVAEAAASYRADLERRGLSHSVKGKFRLMLQRLNDAYPHKLTVLTAEDMRRFAASWGYAPTTQRAEIERLRQFWGFCVDSGWVDRNPAKGVKPPKEPPPQVEPFTPNEIATILAACDAMNRAFVLLMRYTGLRVGDVARLEKSRIQGDRLTLRTTKTSAVVAVPLPPVVLDALKRFPHVSERWFFWSGKSKPDAFRNSWCNRLKKLFDSSGVKNAHSHRFRHTFAAELLLRGVPVQDVAALLGHASVKTTERHYSAWIRARQERLEEHVRTAWSTFEVRDATDNPLNAENKRVRNGGEGGIRTHGTRKGTTVFETARFNHSRTSPSVIVASPYASARPHGVRDVTVKAGLQRRVGLLF